MLAMSYIFGPVRSRRLGLSLGVDIEKTCNYDCLYCECGPTNMRSNELKHRANAKLIIAELQETIKKRSDIDFITITGAGEPTLNLELGKIIKGISKISKIPIAVLTNGSCMCHDEVRSALSLADLVIPSLDAVTEDIFRKINRPDQALSCEELINGIVLYRSQYPKQTLWLEILLVKNINDSDKYLKKFPGVVKRIKPDRIDICTVLRPPAYVKVEASPMERLKKLREILGSKARIVVDEREPQLHESIIVEEQIKAILIRRPSRVVDLTKHFHDAKLVDMILKKLGAKGMLQKEIFNKQLYYRIKNN